MQGLLVLIFVGLLAVLLYTLRSMTAERVCRPAWAGYPEGMHLNIAIVTMTDSNSKQQDKANVRIRGDGIQTEWSLCIACWMMSLREAVCIEGMLGKARCHDHAGEQMAG